MPTGRYKTLDRALTRALGEGRPGIEQWNYPLKFCRAALGPDAPPNLPKMKMGSVLRRLASHGLVEVQSTGYRNKPRKFRAARLYWPANTETDEKAPELDEEPRSHMRCYTGVAKSVDRLRDALRSASEALDSLETLVLELGEEDRRDDEVTVLLREVMSRMTTRTAR